MVDIWQLDKVSDNNQQTWPEGTMEGNQINNAGRDDESLMARWYADWNGTLETAGTGTAYTAAANTNRTGYGNDLALALRIHTNCGDNPTLNVSSLGAVPWLKNGGDQIKADELRTGMLVVASYRDGNFYTMSSVYQGTGASADIGTSVGDVAGVVDIGGGVPGISAEISGLRPGSVELVYTDTTTLTLQPKDGSAVPIQGQMRNTGAVTLSNGGLTASTLYYVYAAWSGSAVTLEAATDVPTTDSFGFRVKTGETNKTLVGMCYTSSGSAFVQGLVRTWFNNRGFKAAAYLASDYTVTTTAASVGLEIAALVWSGESVLISGAATMQSGAGDTLRIYPALDGGVKAGGSAKAVTTTGNDSGAISGVFESLSEGRHTFDMFAGATVASGAVIGASGDANSKASISISIG